MYQLREHKGRVCALAYSPDGKALATAGEDRKVRVWDLTARRVQTVLKGHKGCVYALAFSPDGRSLVSGGGRNELFWWQPGVEAPARLGGSPVMVAAVAFSPDGLTLASANGNVFDSQFEGQVELRSTDGREPRWTTAVEGGAWAVTFDPDGATLAVGSGGQRVELRKRAGLWNPGTEGPAVLRTGTAVRGLSFSPGGAVLAVATGCKVQLWGVNEQAVRHMLLGHKDVVWAAVYSPDGRRLFSGSEDGQVKVWDVSTGAEIRSYDWDIGKVRAVAVSPDGLTAAAAGDGAIAVWDIEE